MNTNYVPHKINEIYWCLHKFKPCLFDQWPDFDIHVSKRCTRLIRNLIESFNFPQNGIPMISYDPFIPYNFENYIQ